MTINRLILRFSGLKLENFAKLKYFLFKPIRTIIYKFNFNKSLTLQLISS